MRWLCQVHVQRDYDREIPKHIGKQGAIVVKRLLEKMMFVPSTELCKQTKQEILSNAYVVDDVELKRYLNKNWFNIMDMWCSCHRQIFHYKVDTTNIAESWFKFSVSVTNFRLTTTTVFIHSSLKHLLRNAANKMVSQFAIVDHKILPEGKAARLRAYKQSTLHRTVNPALYSDLEAVEYQNRPDWIISELRSNKLQSKQIQNSDVKIIDNKQHLFTVSRKVNTKHREYTVNVQYGYCNYGYFVENRIPCSDMHVILRIVESCNFTSLPSQLLYATHMVIHTQTDDVPNNRYIRCFK